jgi:hypothetical protein
MLTPYVELRVGPERGEASAMIDRIVVGPDELTDFEARTFTQWDRASLSAVRVAIDRRRKELAR